MADILIKGMKMPEGTGTLHIQIKRNGDCYYKYSVRGKERFTKAIKVKPHGRLVEADKLVANWDSQDMRGGNYTAFHFIESVNKAPTVLEANYGTDS